LHQTQLEPVEIDPCLDPCQGCREGDQEVPYVFFLDCKGFLSPMLGGLKDYETLELQGLIVERHYIVNLAWLLLLFLLGYC